LNGQFYHKLSMFAAIHRHAIHTAPSSRHAPMTIRPASTTDIRQQPTDMPFILKRTSNRHATHTETNNRHAATTSRHITHIATTNRLVATNWLPIRMIYRLNSIMRNRCQLFECKRSPIGWPTSVKLRTTTPRSTRLHEMLQQRTEWDQQQSCLNNEQNRINNRDT
jgi:hypothetical protein